MKSYQVHDISQAECGERIIERTILKMPIMDFINIRFKTEQTVRGLKIMACLHVTKETAQFAITLKEGGAEVYLVNSVPGSTQDEVAAALAVHHGIHVFADTAMSEQDKMDCFRDILKLEPDLIVDEGAILMRCIYEEFPKLTDRIIGSVEHTAAGVFQLRSLEQAGALKHPAIALDSSKSKHLFDNHFGVGQTAIASVMSATNMLISGINLVVCGYGNCGSGIAKRAKGMGANVLVTEIDTFRALQAYMDGYTVCPIHKAAETGDVFITATGNTKVIDWEAIRRMKDGAILLNCGSGGTEINVDSIRAHSVSSAKVNEQVTEYILENGSSILLLAEGKVANLVCSDGNPSELLDLSFATEALAVEYLVRHAGQLAGGLIKLPEELDEKIARMKLRAQHVFIDKQTEEQKNYSKRVMDDSQK